MFVYIHLIIAALNDNSSLVNFNPQSNHNMFCCLNLYSISTIWEADQKIHMGPSGVNWEITLFCHLGMEAVVYSDEN